MVRYDSSIMIKGTEVNIIQGEIWKPIKGYEGLYFISNLSRVKRITPRGKFKERLLYKRQNGAGYWCVSLCKNGKAKCKRVHRLVAEAFIPNPENKTQVGHKDETRTNDSIENLEWVTPKENCNMPLHKLRIANSQTGKKDSLETKLKKRNAQLGEKSHLYGKRGKDNRFSKPILQYNKNGELMKEYENAEEAYRITGIASSHIRECCNGLRKTSGGYCWKFKNK